MMTIFQALGFMALGALIVECFEYKAWRRYKEGKHEVERKGDRQWIDRT